MARRAPLSSDRSNERARRLLPRACIAVDWSGALATVRKRLWLAESKAGRWVRIENGFTREELVQHLIERARADASLVVGLDFSFSFPAWFLASLAISDAEELWQRVAREGEDWLARCEPPFWGRPLTTRPAPVEGRSEWRVTESEHPPIRGVGPKSTFQIGGAGAVGTGSLRGMPHLSNLRAAGFSIWPFDAPRLPMVLEIYPRYLTGPVEKSNPAARALYLQARHPRESRAMLDLAASSEDAFDAAVSSAQMLRFARDFPRLARLPRTRLDRREGRIWVPLKDPLFEC